jgi:hypothetical protein
MGENGKIKQRDVGLIPESHITSRANRKEHLLASKTAKYLFVEMLLKLRAKYAHSIIDSVSIP